MQSFTQKLNVWQEVSTIEALNASKNLAYPTTPQEDNKNNQASQETWFELLQYPTENEPQGRQE
jgi:hypothetical protein